MKSEIELNGFELTSEPSSNVLVQMAPIKCVGVQKIDDPLLEFPTAERQAANYSWLMLTLFVLILITIIIGSACCICDKLNTPLSEVRSEL